MIEQDVKTIINHLIDDGYSHDEALDWLNEARSRVEDGEDPEEVLYEIGLEPDYVFALIR